ncbi:hypothetical protein [Isobaculum melis]|uniref:Uncharacterized protein n=1 Tax=Isobaculum melis TaxID=142588 RepID=A0A1H9RM67_9LACT|nr:hypothetical protein [Isobaculum melis]SER73880.1 hypothetical protein SAMN04488559_104163 [Isobaculum melis]
MTKLFEYEFILLSTQLQVGKGQINFNRNFFKKIYLDQGRIGVNNLTNNLRKLISDNYLTFNKNSYQLTEKGLKKIIQLQLIHYFTDYMN